MAHTINFDTHAFAQRLKTAGFSSDQVDTLIDLARESTPRDLVTNESLDTRLTILEQRMTIKLGSLLIVAMGMLLALLKLFPAAS